MDGRVDGPFRVTAPVSRMRVEAGAAREADICVRPPAEPADEAVQKQKAARAQPAPPAKAGKSLAMDTKLVTILRGAVEAVARDDGWAAMSAAGSAAKRQAPIDARNYGARNCPALFEATGLFEIVKGEGGHSFVADKRNKDRAAKPAP